MSPAFDVNPTPGDEAKWLSTAIGFDDYRAEPALALECCEYFRLGKDEARSIAHDMVRTWWLAQAGLGDGISKQSVQRMETCFEAGVRRLKAL